MPRSTVIADLIFLLAALAAGMSSADAAGMPPMTGQPDMPGMDHSMPGMTMPMDMPMNGVLGDYPMTRDASGTAWQPDTSRHDGIHLMAGDWMVMLHGLINGVYDTQNGPRGDEKAFVSGMVMGMARRTFPGGDTLQFRAMLSPDPFMGASGYPLLLATGETADGKTPLVDRQHPHDLVMELSASYSLHLGDKTSLFLYGGLPGEPAFGPPAFMHRQSIMDSPEAPITHHWLDSTHITFGVVTAGFVYDDFKIEASRFHGREPDQHRFDIEAGALDSTAVRLSWNPLPELSLQASWVDQHSPEQLRPDQNQIKWSASAIYATSLAGDGWWSVTAAWGRRTEEGLALNAVALEGAINWQDRWTLFARAEWTENSELLGDAGHGRAYDVGKASLGLIRDFRIADHAQLGLGGLHAVNFTPAALDLLYDDTPTGAVAFVRLKIE